MRHDISNVDILILHGQECTLKEIANLVGCKRAETIKTRLCKMGFSKCYDINDVARRSEKFNDPLNTLHSLVRPQDLPAPEEFAKYDLEAAALERENK